MDKQDKLERIFEMQRLLDDKIVAERGLDFTKQQWIEKDMLAIISELSEALMETNFKWWKNDKAVNEDKLKEELIDVLHFFISLCIRCGLSADEMYQIYMAKNEENIKRQEGLSDKAGYSLSEIAGENNEKTQGEEE